MSGADFNAVTGGPNAGPWAICDRCGRKRRHRSLRREWTQMLVCGACFDPRPAQLDPPKIDAREGAPIKNPRPDVTPETATFVSLDAPVTWDDL